MMPDSYPITIHKQKHYYVEFFLIAIAFFALFIKILPVAHITALLMIYAIIRSNLYENVFGLIVFYPVLAGFVFNTIGIPYVGGLMKYLGFLLLLVMWFSGKAKMINVTKGLIPLLVLLIVFTISVFTTKGGDVAVGKLTSTARHGIMVFFAFVLMFSNTEKFDFTKLGMLFLVLAVFMIPMSIVTNGISGPSSLTDFGFLRYQTHEGFIGTETNEDLHVSYQQTGLSLLQALGFFLVDSKKNKLSLVIVFFAILFISQLYVGSRQAIVSLIVIAIAWALFINHKENGKKKESNLFIRLGVLVVVVVASLFVITTLTAEEGLLSSVAEEGYIEGGGRGAWLLSGVEQFLSRPIWGVGYGRFVVFGEYGSYPHNLFVELLCETGLVGFSIAILLAIITAFQVKKAALPFLALFLAYFLRSMVSGSLSLNITVFAMLFAMTSLITSSFASDK